MASVDVRKSDGSGKAGKAELPEEIFGVRVNVPVMHRVVRAQEAAARAGTHDTKTRAEVRGGGKKPWRQKGTGRARQGSTRAPQWTGGGVVFGPHPRDYTLRVNKKEKQLALRSALSDRRAGGNVVVVDGIPVEREDPRPRLTRQATKLLAGLDLTDRKVLLVVEGVETEAILGFRNLERVHVINFDQLNTYDVLYSDVVVFTRGSLDAFLGRQAGSAEAPAGGSGAAAADSDDEDELVLETPEATK
jgi:large subunit ribosomal protein L4